MTKPVGRNLVEVEFTQKLGAGILFLIYGRIAAIILDTSANAMIYYGLAITFALLQLFLVRCIGKTPLIRDLEEICLYDVFVAIYGYAIHLMGFKQHSFWILAAAVAFLMFIRLVWCGKNTQGELLAAWPVFGLLGLMRKNRYSEPMSARQKIGIYCACVIAIIIPASSWLLFEIIPETIHTIPFLIAVLYSITRITTIIETTATEREAAIAENAALTARTEMDAQTKERNIDLCHATHDVIAPVTAMARLAQSLTQSTDITQAQTIGRHFEAGLYELGDLLEEIVKMAEVVTNVTPPNDETINMDDLSYALYEKLLPLAQERGITFTTDEARFTVASNTWLLQRILSNLLANAILHGDATTKVRLVIKRNAKYCTLRVWDTGQGIPDANGPDRAANFANLLKEVARKKSNDPTPSIKTGHMLGLRSVMRMCNTLGIRMTLVSKPGKGSMFRFRVPLADASTL